jgi:hypothetical protein
MKTEALVDLILDQTIAIRKRLQALEDRTAAIEKRLECKGGSIVFDGKKPSKKRKPTAAARSGRRGANDNER